MSIENGDLNPLTKETKRYDAGTRTGWSFVTAGSRRNGTKSTADLCLCKRIRGPPRSEIRTGRRALRGRGGSRWAKLYEWSVPTSRTACRTIPWRPDSAHLEGHGRRSKEHGGGWTAVRDQQPAIRGHTRRGRRRISRQQSLCGADGRRLFACESFYT